MLRVLINAHLLCFRLLFSAPSPLLAQNPFECLTQSIHSHCECQEEPQVQVRDHSSFHSWHQFKLAADLT